MRFFDNLEIREIKLGGHFFSDGMPESHDFIPCRNHGFLKVAKSDSVQGPWQMSSVVHLIFQQTLMTFVSENAFTYIWLTILQPASNPTPSTARIHLIA